MTQQGESNKGGSVADHDAMNQGMRVLSYLIAGVALYGGLGWVGDHFSNTSFLLPLGIVLGAGLGIYTTIKRLEATGTTTSSVGTRGSTQGPTEGER